MLKQFIHESQMKFIRFRKFIIHYSHEAPETYKNHKVPTQIHKALTIVYVSNTSLVFL